MSNYLKTNTTFLRDLVNTNRFSENFRSKLLGIIDTVDKNKGRITDRQLEVLQKHVYDKIQTVPNSDVEETIKKVDGKYAVYPERGGKRLGTHSTRAKAEKQLAAIHINKEIITPADPSKVDSKELTIGIDVEMEHTDSPREAMKIALQHLAEDPHYYSKLKKVGLEEESHEPMNPGILKKRLGKLSCSKVRAERAKLKDKGTTYYKALSRYLNYHCGN